MDRSKIFYLMNNKKQTLVSCAKVGHDIGEVLKFDGKEWVKDDEVEEVVKKCYKFKLIEKYAKKIYTDYELNKILNAKIANFTETETTANDENSETDKKN